MSSPDGSAHRYRPVVVCVGRELAPFHKPQGYVWRPSHVAAHRRDRNPALCVRPVSPEDQVRHSGADNSPPGLRREDPECSEAENLP